MVMMLVTQINNQVHDGKYQYAYSNAPKLYSKSLRVQILPSIYFFKFSKTVKLIEFTTTDLVAAIGNPFQKLPILMASFIVIRCAICLERITSNG